MQQVSVLIQPRKRVSPSPTVEEDDIPYSEAQNQGLTRKRLQLQNESHGSVVETPKTPSGSSEASSPIHEASPVREELPILQASPTPQSNKTRGNLRGRSNVNYDMRFHPADIILRPNHAATRAARQITAKSEIDTKVSLKPDHNEGEQTESRNRVRDCSVKNEGNPENEHRYTRTGRQVKVADYDMKYHPMDDVLRPKAAAKRYVHFQGLSSSPTSSPTLSISLLPDGIDGLENTTTLVESSTGASPEGKGPFSKPLPRNWSQTSEFDRRLYQLQQGAPPTVESLPLRWSQVVSRLVEERHLTIRQLGNCGGHVALQRRYEAIREAVRESFGISSVDSLKDGLTWMYAEDIQIFDLSVSHKYWRHHRDSIVAQSTDATPNSTASQHHIEDFAAKESFSFATESTDLSDSIVPADNEDLLRETDEGLLQMLRNELLTNIQPFMSENEVEELVSQQNSKDGEKPEFITQNDDHQHHHMHDQSPLSERDDELPLSRNAPPGVFRAAQRMRNGRRSQSLDSKEEQDRQPRAIQARIDEVDYQSIFGSASPSVPTISTSSNPLDRTATVSSTATGGRFSSRPVAMDFF